MFGIPVGIYISTTSSSHFQERERERERTREKKRKIRKSYDEKKRKNLLEGKNERHLYHHLIFLNYSIENLVMNETSNFHSIPIHSNTQLADRWLSIYSLILILIGTPCNLLCCLIYFQKGNRTNSIKTIFGYLAILDTIVLYTFNLNYVVREFNIDYQLNYYDPKNFTRKTSSLPKDVHINIVIVKKNLEEYSLFICRSLSYLGNMHVFISSLVFRFVFSFFYSSDILLGINLRFSSSLFINLEIKSI